MNAEFMQRFESYRNRLFLTIKAQLATDSHCKAYEGTLHLNYPSYFGGKYSIGLDCYVLGPNRHYDYEGDTWDECLVKAERDLRLWACGLISV